MPPIDDMREEEIFATAPAVANATPSDAEIAAGFPSGDASKPFFNGLWFRFSEILYKVQTTAQAQKIGVQDGTGAADASLKYKDHFVGQTGTDALSRTPIVGNALRNDGGASALDYIIGDNSTVIKNSNNALRPLYTNCGETSALLKFEMQIILKVNSLTAETVKAGFSTNCIGSYERTDVLLTAVKSTGKLYVGITSWDTLGTTGTLLIPGIPVPVADTIKITDRVITFRAEKSPTTGFMVLSIPEIDYEFDTGVAMVPASASNDHGFVLTENGFSMNNLTIYNEVLF